MHLNINLRLIISLRNVLMLMTGQRGPKKAYRTFRRGLHRLASLSIADDGSAMLGATPSSLEWFPQALGKTIRLRYYIYTRALVMTSKVSSFFR